MIIKRYFQKSPTAMIQNQLELEKNEPIDIFEETEMNQKMNSILADYSSIIHRDKEKNMLDDRINTHLISLIQRNKRLNTRSILNLENLFTRPSYAIISFGLVVIIAITVCNLYKTDEIINSSQKYKAQIINRTATKKPDGILETTLTHHRSHTENSQFQPVSSTEEITNYLLTVKDPAYLCSDLIINETDTFIKYTTITEEDYN